MSRRPVRAGQKIAGSVPKELVYPVSAVPHRTARVLKVVSVSNDNERVRVHKELTPAKMPRNARSGGRWCSASEDREDENAV